MKDKTRVETFGKTPVYKHSDRCARLYICLSGACLAHRYSTGTNPLKHREKCVSPKTTEKGPGVRKCF